MNTLEPQPGCRNACFRPSRTANTPSWRQRLWALVLFFSIGASALAQTISNCVEIVCPPPFVTNVICGDIFTPTAYPVSAISVCPQVSPLVNCNPPVGTSFPPGVHTVNCSVVANGQIVSGCSFTVVVIRDTIPPVIHCPEDLVVGTCPDPAGACSAVVNYPSPVAFDNSGTVSVVCLPPSGSVFPCGSTTVHCVATDRCQNTAECSFKITVTPDGVVPEIKCPDDLALVTCSNGVVVNYPLPLVNPAGSPLVCVPPPGSVFPVGTTAVLCTTATSCGTNRCSFKIEVVQAALPEILCPAQPVVVTAPCGTNCVPVSYPLPAVSGGFLVGCLPAPGSCFPVGTTVVTCRAKNDCNQTKDCQFEVVVNAGQGEPVGIQCPANLVVNSCSNNAAGCEIVLYPAPVVVNGALVGCQPPSGSCFPLGVTTVTCVATNRCGEPRDCSFTVVVRPAPLPQILCPSNLVASAPCGTNCVPVNYPLPSVNGGVLIGCQPPSGSCFPVGFTAVICRATNDCGRFSACEFVVEVRPGQGDKPEIVCPQNLTVTACESNCAVVLYPAPVVLNGTLLNCVPPSGTCFPIGVTTVHCVAKNDCGEAQCSFDVIVRPSPAPVIQCPTNPIVALAPCGTNCVPVTYPLPSVNGGVLIGCQPPSGSCFPVGFTAVICRATNDCGRFSACEFVVEVRPGQGLPPVIQCPTNPIVVHLVCGTNCVPVNYPLPGVLNGTLIGCNPPSGFCFPVGVSSVTCRATNDCGTFAVCQFEVEVRPGNNLPPIINCPSNIVVVAPCASNCVPVSYPAPTVINGSLLGCLPPSGSCFPLGLTPVICRATNACGLASACEFVVRVVEGQGHPPVLNCPSNIVAETCQSNCVPVSYPLPGVLNGTLIGCLPPSGSCFPIGVNPVLCVASNACGRVECSFNVVVRETPIVVNCPSNIVVTTCANGEFVNFPVPGGNPTGGTVNGVCNPPSGSYFPLGTNRVVCCVRDACQRTNCCEFLVIVAPGTPCVKPPANMVLWLPFDEPIGPVANNIIPGAPNGIHANGPVPLLGQYVLNSLGFDGLNDFVRVPNYAAIVLSGSDITIDAWILRRNLANNPGREVLVSKLRQVPGALGPRGYEFYLNNGVMNLLLGGVVAQNFNSTTLVPLDNQWHHVAVTVRRSAGGQVRFYLDGAVVNTQNGAITAPLGNNSPLFVGASTLPAPSSHFRGPIDEVEIFNRALTPAEIFGLWNARTSGKCKITCTIPWDVSFPPGVNCITVTARICNRSAVPMPIHWTASGPMPFGTPSGSFLLAPFSCTNVPITICRPTNNVPVGSVVRWNLAVFPGGNCPVVCTGSVINPGPVVVTVPTDPTVIRGTNRPGIFRIGLNGLPPGVPLRLRAIGPDMEPDLSTISLNGLPPGTPFLVGDALGLDEADANGDYDISVRFAEGNPIGTYTILVEADVNGDTLPDVIGSFDVENTVVPPPTLNVVGGRLEWNDEGDGAGVLEMADSLDGPWVPVPGNPGEVPAAGPGGLKFFRIAVPGAAE